MVRSRKQYAISDSGPQLFCAARGVQSHEGKRRRNRKQHDSRNHYHGYISPTASMSRSTRRCTAALDAVMTMIAATAANTVCAGAEAALETTQPTKLISVTTITPNQNLRYAICSFALSSLDTHKL